MRLHLTVTLPFGFFFLPLFLSLDISPNAYSPWDPGECDAVQMPSQGSLDSQKAKLTSILHLVYLMPEE